MKEPGKPELDPPLPAPGPVGAPAVPAGAAQALPLCSLVATGGTIAMRIDPVAQAPVPAVSGEDLVGAVPGLAGVARIEVHDLFNVASGYMDPLRWIMLQRTVIAALARPEVAGVIVSHGTDTLEETAWFLDLTVPGDKPVVLTGAQRNASEPDFDGPRNLLDAARACVAPEARGKGAMIVFNGRIHAAREAAKVHTSSIEAFGSGDAGLLGQVDRDRVVFHRAPLRRLHVALVADRLPRVEIVPMYGGADGALLRAALSAGARGIVVQALGWGNVNVPMYEAIREAIGQGVQVVVATRVPGGRVLPQYGYAGGGRTLQEAGAVFAGDLPPHKARLLLMLALQAPADAATLQRLFDR